jgi:hypothetical protein
VSLAAEVRDYTIDTDVPGHSFVIDASPLRIGDSFEDMKRKMIPFSKGLFTVSIIQYGTYSIVHILIIHHILVTTIEEERPIFLTPPTSKKDRVKQLSFELSPRIQLSRGDSNKSIDLSIIVPLSHDSVLYTPRAVRKRAASTIAESYVNALLKQVLIEKKS